MTRYYRIINVIVIQLRHSALSITFHFFIAFWQQLSSCLKTTPSTSSMSLTRSFLIELAWHSFSFSLARALTIALLSKVHDRASRSLSKSNHTRTQSQPTPDHSRTKGDWKRVKRITFLSYFFLGLITQNNRRYWKEQLKMSTKAKI